MDSKFLGQSEHRPLSFELGLGLQLLGEGDVATRPAGLPDECDGNPRAAGRSEAFCCEAHGNLAILVARGPKSQYPLHKVLVAAHIRLA
jgi:hypothetical protein